MKKKIFAGLLALCMLICMLPVVALAAGELATIDGVVINDGTTVNGATLNGNTLTLENVNAENITLSASVTKIVVKGINNFTFISNFTFAAPAAAIWAEGDVAISGDGILNINDAYDFGIYAEGKVVVEGVALTIDGAAVGVYSDETGNVSNVTVPTPTWIWDFTKPTDKLMADGVTPDIGAVPVGTTDVDYDLTKGYLSTTCKGNDPAIWMTSQPTVPGKDMAYMVIKYANRAPLIDQAGIFYNGGDTGIVNWATDPLGSWRWETNDGSWDVMVTYDGHTVYSGLVPEADTENYIPAGQPGYPAMYSHTTVFPWADDDTVITDFRLDYWNSGMSASNWGGVDIAYIAFFSTLEDANTYAAAEEKKLEVEAASGITADKVFTQGGKTYTADTVISLTDAQTTNKIDNTKYTATAWGTSRDCFYGIKGSTYTVLNAEAMHGSTNDYFDDLVKAPLDMTNYDSVALVGWIRNGDQLTDLGYVAGGVEKLVEVNSDTTYTLNIGGTNAEWGPNANNASPVGTKIWYDDGLVGALQGDSAARRIWIVIPASELAQGISEVRFLGSTDGGATKMTLTDSHVFCLSNGALAYDYTDTEGGQYAKNGTDLLVNGKDSGLDLVVDGTNYWAVGGTIIEVTANGATYSHGNYFETGYYVGTPYIVKVNDANDNGYNGATVKMYNEQGKVIARATTAAGEATLYAPCTANYTFSVEGDFTTKTGITATNYVASVVVDAAASASDIKAVTIAGGAVVTINNAEYAILTATGEQTVVLENAALNADVDTVVANFAGISITGASVTVGETFSLNVFLSASLNGSKLNVNGVDYAVSYVNGEYVGTITGITPQTVADQKTINVVDAIGFCQATKNYSVKENLVNLYNNPASSTALKTLVADLLNYAAAAQIYTAYNTSNLANSDGFVGSTVTPGAADDKFTLTETTDVNNKFNAATVYYDNTNKLVVDFKATGNVYLAVYDENGVEVTDVVIENTSGSYFLVYTDTINANEFDKVYTFKLLDANDNAVQNLTYSVNTYAYHVTDDAGLGLALYRYGVSAAAYLNA